jgi:PTS system mannose-specific IIA component
MRTAVEEILKEKVSLVTVGFDPASPLEKIRDDIRRAMAQLQGVDGVIILTDLFGATPSNLCRELCVEGKVQMVTGCNLPMVLKAVTGHFEGGVKETAAFLVEYGREKIKSSGG